MEQNLKRIDEYEPLDQLNILKLICNRIYIARNITLSEESILDSLKQIDMLFRDENLN